MKSGKNEGRNKWVMRFYCTIAYNWKFGLGFTAHSKWLIGPLLQVKKLYLCNMQKNFSPDTFPDLLGHKDVKEIAEKHGKTPAQVLLNFLVAQRVVVIPKSTSVNRLKVFYYLRNSILNNIFKDLCCRWICKVKFGVTRVSLNTNYF